MSKLRRRLGKPIAIHLILLSVTVVNVFPVYYMVSASFKGELEVVGRPWGLPNQLGFEHYWTLLVEKGFLQLFFNSVIITGCSVTVALAISCLAAYAIARLDFWGRQSLFDFITALMAIPPIVVIVPLFVLMSGLGLINRYPSAIIVYIGFILPFSIFILTGFFSSTPQEILDAAKVDGANDLRILTKIVLPLAKAPLATLAIINGLWVWNELLIAIMFLQTEEMRTLVAGISFLYGRNVRQIPLVMSGSVLATIPMIAVLAVGQRAFVKGLTSGAIK